MLVTKTAEAFTLLDKGEFKKALSLFKTFKLGLTKEERRAIQITYESEAGKSGFYSALGIDLISEKNAALSAIEKLRSKSNFLQL